MSKPLLVYQAPVFTRSGYGDHARDILKSLFDLDKYDIKIVPTRWGNTPQNQADPNTEFGKWMLSNVVTQVNRKPDIFIQMSVANEFEPKGNFNIGITAGVETTIIPKEFIDGSNKMNLILVPSHFTKSLFDKTQYQEQNKQTGEVIKVFKVERPVEVLFEGVDIDTYINYSKSETDVLEGIETDFNFLFVGHWLKGNLGQDRKDVGMVIKTFSTVFKYLPKDKRPGLILKTSHAGFSVIDRETTREKIENVIKDLGDDVPPIYLLHGDLKDTEMAQLYNHSKVKAMVSFTKGEGYGRPLAEFATTGKPILVSKWSGHVDFLPEQHTVFLDGQLTQVDNSAADKFLLKDSKWFTVNYSDAANKIYKVFNEYDSFLKQSSGLKTNIVNNFTMEKMTEELGKIMDKYIGNVPVQKAFNMPKLGENKLRLPKLNKTPGQSELKLPKLNKI
jgi:glycosyltransferase involved in cell wall biosynthesis